ncbi:uncharacterized protein C12orf76 homolog [Octodon degus]|uniref:Uncharacterized protein C12orf76 homolog n=1 Tax=Octodon degus TaxID=10160 RepID=A0A6P6EX40_OCTDE|nr:uncharacterized protein C12orf76 homolog [Octodon degus]
MAFVKWNTESISEACGEDLVVKCTDSRALRAGEDAASGVVVAVPGSVHPPGGSGGGPEPGGAARTEPAVCSAARAEPGVDGNHIQHSAGDCYPHGILCLQAHSASVTVKQVLPRGFGTRISCNMHGPMEKLELEPSYSGMTVGLTVGKCKVI